MQQQLHIFCFDRQKQSCLRAFFLMIFCQTLALLAWTSPVYAAQHLQPIDLSQSQWDKNVTRLNETWELYWQQFLEPGLSLPLPSAYIETGKPWNGFVLQDGRTLESFGYATYRMQVTGLKPQPQGYQIGVRGAASAIKIMVYSEDPSELIYVASSGEPHKNAEKPSKKPVFLKFYPKLDATYTILMHVSNHHANLGGIWNTEIGVGDAVGERLRVEGVFDLIAFGVSLSVAVYSLMMWVRRRADRAALYLSLMAFAAMLRILGTSAFINDIINENYYSLLMRSEYASMPMGLCSYFMFLLASFRGQKIAVMDKGLLGFGLVFLLPLTLLPIALFTSLLPFYQAYVVVVAIRYITIMLDAIRKRQGSVGIVLTGMTVIIIGMAFDLILVFTLSLFSYMITAIAVSFFLILQAQLVAKRAAEAFFEAELLSRTLRNEMQAKVMMVSDLAHRTNNPLNASTLAGQNLFENIEQIKRELNVVFAAQDHNDPEVQLLIKHFDESLNGMTSYLKVLEQGMARTALSVSEIRILSGVDGYQNQEFILDELWQAVLARLFEHAGKVRLNNLSVIKVKELSLVIHSNKTVMMLTIERLIRAWLDDAQGVVEIKLDWQGSEHTSETTLDLEVINRECLSLDKNDAEIIEQLTHLMSPYGIRMERMEDRLGVSIHINAMPQSDGLLMSAS